MSVSILVDSWVLGTEIDVFPLNSHNLNGEGNAVNFSLYKLVIYFSWSSKEMLSYAALLSSSVSLAFSLVFFS